MSQQYSPEYSPWQQSPDMPPSSAPPPMAPPPVKKRFGVQMLVLTVILLLAVALILHASVFRITHVTVIGNEKIPWEQVVRDAGLVGSVGYFSLNEEKIKTGINSNRYLEYLGMEKIFPNALTLYVRERASCADIQVMGVAYQLDAEGMVLERDGAVSLTGDRMVVTGFQVRSIKLGQRIEALNAEQLNAYQAVVNELQLQQFIDQISELNLSDSENLYLITRDGYTIHLGDSKYMRAKIGTVRAVVDKLHEMGKYGGVIEAKTPGEANYSPPSM